MSRRSLFTDTQLETLFAFPASEVEIVRYYTFDEQDLSLIRRRRRENGVKFGRPAKLTAAKKQDIYTRRLAGATIGQLAREFSLGEATLYRALSAVKQVVVGHGRFS